MDHQDTWRRRLDGATQLLEAVRRAGDARLIETHPVTVEVFGDLGCALAYLHDRWMLLFGNALDTALDAGADCDGRCVAEVWSRVQQREPELDATLALFTDHPAVMDRREHHTLLLAEATSGRVGRLPAWSSPRRAPTRPPAHPAKPSCRWFTEQRPRVAAPAPGHLV